MSEQSIYITLLTLLKHKYAIFSNLIDELDIYKTYLKNMALKELYEDECPLLCQGPNVFYNKCINYISSTKSEIYEINKDIYEIEKQLIKITTN